MTCAVWLDCVSCKSQRKEREERRTDPSATRRTRSGHRCMLSLHVCNAMQHKPRVSHHTCRDRGRSGLPSRGLMVTNGTLVPVKLLLTIRRSSPVLAGACHAGCIAVFCSDTRRWVWLEDQGGTRDKAYLVDTSQRGGSSGHCGQTILVTGHRYEAETGRKCEHTPVVSKQHERNRRRDRRRGHALRAGFENRPVTRHCQDLTRILACVHRCGHDFRVRMRNPERDEPGLNCGLRLPRIDRCPAWPLLT
jgi:hypothetical protein